MRSSFGLLVSVVALAWPAFANGQANVAPTVSLKLSSPTVATGKTLQAVLIVTFAQGLHGYQNPPSDPTLIPVSVRVSDKSFRSLKVVYPKGTPVKMNGEPKPVAVYEGTIKIPLSVSAPATPGKKTFSIVLEYQQCNANSCFQPGSITAQAIVIVKPRPVPGMATVGKRTGR